MTSNDIVKRMIYLRKKRGWSQRKLAIEAGLPPYTISRIEHFKNNWNCKTMDKINNVLGGTVYGYM